MALPPLSAPRIAAQRVWSDNVRREKPHGQGADYFIWPDFFISEHPLEMDGRTFTMSQMEIYEKLWSDAISAFERGHPKLDPYLPDKTDDSRRGVTLVFRPAANVRDAVAAFISRLADILPGQYFYRREELHVTVLSIFSGTEHWRQELERFERCRPIIGEVLKTQRPFKIGFKGVTASPDSVLIQGFPSGDGLAAIRSAIRDAFARGGFADMLDRRYKVIAAHITIMRFCGPCLDMKPLLTFLKENRQTDFGECEIDRLELVLGDWYASAEKVKTLEEYRLA